MSQNLAPTVLNTSVRTGTSTAPYPAGPQAASPPRGFEQLFRAQYPVLVRIAYGVLRDVHLAEDVAQEVLIAAQRRFPDPSASEHAAAWARIAATHLALNAVRSRERRGAQQRREPLDRSPAGPKTWLLTATREPPSAWPFRVCRGIPRRCLYFATAASAMPRSPTLWE